MGYLLDLLEYTAIAVGLMSGILSIFREWYTTHYPERVPLKNLFWSSVRVAFIISAAVAWFGEHSKWNVSQKELQQLSKRIDDLSQPQFELEFISLLAGPLDGGIGSHVMVIAKLSNLGAPSAALGETWKLEAETRGGVIHTGVPEPIGTDGTHFCWSGEGPPGRMRLFLPEDSLDSKASHVIERNGYQQGVLIFDFPTLSNEGLNASSTVLVLSVQDVRRTVFRRKESLESLKSKTHLGFIEGVKYLYLLPSAECLGKTSP